MTRRALRPLVALSARPRDEHGVVLPTRLLVLCVSALAVVAVSTRRSVGAWSRVATKVIDAMATASTDSITTGDGKATPRSSRRRLAGRPGLGKEAMGKVTNRERAGLE